MQNSEDIIAFAKKLQRMHYMANGGSPSRQPEQAIQNDYEYKEAMLADGHLIIAALLDQQERLKRYEEALEEEASRCVPYMSDSDQERHSRLNTALNPIRSSSTK